MPRIPSGLAVKQNQIVRQSKHFFSKHKNTSQVSCHRWRTWFRYGIGEDSHKQTPWKISRSQYAFGIPSSKSQSSSLDCKGQTISANKESLVRLDGSSSHCWRNWIYFRGYSAEYWGSIRFLISLFICTLRELELIFAVEKKLKKSYISREVINFHGFALFKTNFFHFGIFWNF